MGSPLGRFWHELKRRKVIQVAAAYAIVAWVVIEVVAVTFPTLMLPEWAPRLVVVLALAGFPVAVVLAWVLEWSRSGIRLEPESASSVPAAAAADDRRSIVVLPFSNLSDDKENEFFSDGITEEILNLLARQPGLRLASRTTSFALKNSADDVRTIAQRLDIQMALEGSVRRAGDRVRIIAQLIDAASDDHIWSNSYDRELVDIFELQSEIARCIVDAIDLEPAQGVRRLPPTQSMKAYDYYLKGRQLLHEMSRRGLDVASEMFLRAIEIDPDFALAHAGLADTNSFYAQWFDHDPKKVEAALQASRKALELDPDLPEAHSAYGFALCLGRDYAAATSAFERALAIDPENYEALNLYARARFAQGRNREAARLWARAHEAQPDEFEALSLRAFALTEIDPEESRRLSELAIESIRKRLALKADDIRALSLGACELVRVGRKKEGIEMVDRALAVAADDQGVQYNAICALTKAGELERALDLLEQRLRGKEDIYGDWVANDTDLEPLRDHPRFRALMARIANASSDDSIAPS